MNKFKFITKQGFFIFLDKLSKVIEVKKVLTKLFFIVIAVAKAHRVRRTACANVMKQSTIE